MILISNIVYTLKIASGFHDINQNMFSTKKLNHLVKNVYLYYIYFISLIEKSKLYEYAIYFFISNVYLLDTRCFLLPC